MPTHYDTLGVKPDVGADAIRTAARALLKQWHPDRNRTAGAEDRYKAVNEAYEVLSDPLRRNQYDYSLLPPPSAPKHDLSSSVFGDFTELRRPPKQKKKKARTARVEIDEIPDMMDDDSMGGLV